MTWAEERLGSLCFRTLVRNKARRPHIEEGKRSLMLPLLDAHIFPFKRAVYVVSEI